MLFCLRAHVLVTSACNVISPMLNLLLLLHNPGLLIICGKKVKFHEIDSDKFPEKTANFAGILWEFSGQISLKSKEERFQEKNIGRMSNSGQERKHKSSSNTGLEATILVSSNKKNMSFSGTTGWLTSFCCNLELNTATQ